MAKTDQEYQKPKPDSAAETGLFWNLRRREQAAHKVGKKSSLKDRLKRLPPVSSVARAVAQHAILQGVETKRQEVTDKILQKQELRYAEKEYKKHKKNIKEAENMSNINEAGLASAISAAGRTAEKAYKGYQSARIGVLRSKPGTKYRIARGVINRFKGHHPVISGAGNIASETFKKSAIDVASHRITMHQKRKNDPEYDLYLHNLAKDRAAHKGQFSEEAAAPPGKEKGYNQYHKQHNAHLAIMRSNPAIFTNLRKRQAMRPRKDNNILPSRQKSKTLTQGMEDAVADLITETADHIYEIISYGKAISGGAGKMATGSAHLVLGGMGIPSIGAKKILSRGIGESNDLREWVQAALLAARAAAPMVARAAAPIAKQVGTQAVVGAASERVVNRVNRKYRQKHPT